MCPRRRAYGYLSISRIAQVNNIENGIMSRFNLSLFRLPSLSKGREKLKKGLACRVCMFFGEDIKQDCS
jgi:hypothetical protein